MTPERIRACVHQMCAAIDAGELVISSLDDEQMMLNLAALALSVGLRDELYMLAARCRIGRQQLARIAQ